MIDTSTANEPTVCPFCPLHCDDVVVDAAGQINVDCLIAKSNFAAALSPPVYRIGTRSVSADDAASHAAAVLASIDRPKVTCSGATLGLSRHLSKLAQASRIDLSLDTTPTMAAMRAAMAREGFIGATLGDVKQHADLIWVIGDSLSSLPRLANHFATDAKVRSFETFSIEEMATRSLNSVEDAFGDAHYIAIVFANDAFAPAASTVVAEWWTRWIVAANKTRRVVQVVVDPFQTIRSVAGWTSNQTLTSNSTASDVRFGDAVDQTTRLQIGGLDPGELLADAYLPVQIYGVHIADTVIRGDGAVTLGLGQITDDAMQREPASSFFPLLQTGPSP